MSDESRIRQLLEETLDSQRTPEEVCAEFPGLLNQVRERWRRCQSVEAQIDAIFPPIGRTRGNPRKRFTFSDDVFPQITGYEVDSILGRGGVGVVYRAKHIELNRPVALKMLLAGQYAGPHELARFKLEAQAVASLQHAHIVQVFDVGELEGRPYFTMEFVEGGSLAQKLAGTPQPAPDAAALLEKLATAVHVAHQGGIIHRDLKPSNILLMSDGTPKITDFGLACRFEGEAAIILSGARVGTPSYMAPEQATGKAGAVGPAADIYGLGAILYEMLTGRPPFRAETASETERQLISEDPVAPSRLNRKTPRDLETICLKCLRKDPEKRYDSAAALADDLHRFLAGDPIAARPMGAIEHGVRWIKRKPSLAAALAGSFLLVCMLVGVGVSLALQRSERRHAVLDDLKDVTAFQQQAHWPAARAALERAEARLGTGNSADLRQQFQQARRDLDLVIRLDNIRLSRVTRGDPIIYRVQADKQYEQAFREAELYKSNEPPQGMGERIKSSAIHEALVAALDDWIICVPAKEQRHWLIEAAKAADAQSQSWRARILNEDKWGDREALSAVAREVPIDGQSLSLLLALGERLRLADGDASTFLKRVQREHPADFWANITLGNALRFPAPMEAGGYYRAALASRPEAAVGYCAVGDALRLQTAYDAAIHYYKKAILKDPNYARAYTNLGLALEDKGQLDDAIENFRKSIPLDPDYAWSYFELANALRKKGLLSEAATNYRKTAALDPSNPQAQNGVRSAMIWEGRINEVWSDWKKTIEADPKDIDEWIGYGQLSLFLEHPEEYRRARRELLNRVDQIEDAAAERVSRACLLLPAEGEELPKAVALADRAVATKASTAAWIYPYFLFAKGLANYRQGNFDDAIQIMEGSAKKIMGPCPLLIVAMAQHRQGKTEAAHQSLATAIRSSNWSATKADSRDRWIWQILRREAEEMIAPPPTEKNQ